MSAGEARVVAGTVSMIFSVEPEQHRQLSKTHQWQDEQVLRYKYTAGMMAAFLAAASPLIAHAAEFPLMRVTAMSERELDLPADFADGSSVVLLVYDQNQQPDADSWVPFLNALEIGDANFRYFIVPVLPAGLSIVRGMVEGAIRGSAQDPAQLDRTILIFTDIGALQASLGIDGTQAIHALALDDSGVVLASVSGSFTLARAEILTQAVAPKSLENDGDFGEPWDRQHMFNSIEDAW